MRKKLPGDGAHVPFAAPSLPPRLCCRGRLCLFLTGGDGRGRAGDCSPGPPGGGVDLTAGAVVVGVVVAVGAVSQ